MALPALCAEGVICMFRGVAPPPRHVQKLLQSVLGPGRPGDKQTAKVLNNCSQPLRSARGTLNT
eukprot:2583377-Alexandrium_andersonii.AAC.1